MKRMKLIIVLDDGSGQEDNAPATSAKLQSGKHQRVCVEQERNEMTNGRHVTSLKCTRY